MNQTGLLVIVDFLFCVVIVGNSQPGCQACGDAGDAVHGLDRAGLRRSASTLMTTSTLLPIMPWSAAMSKSRRSSVIEASQPEIAAPFMPGPKPSDVTLSTTSFATFFILSTPVTV